MSAIVNDKGFNKIIENLERLARTELTVGIFEGSVNRDGIEIAPYAYRNEFGLGVPQRSFMRSTYEEKNGWKNGIDQVYDEVIQGRSVESAVGMLGEIVTNDIKTKISNNIPPPNAIETVRRKGSSKTLIDTGAMRQSVRPVITTR
jgi:hypothetical protein